MPPAWYLAGGGEECYSWLQILLHTCYMMPHICHILSHCHILPHMSHTAAYVTYCHIYVTYCHICHVLLHMSHITYTEDNVLIVEVYTLLIWSSFLHLTHVLEGQFHSRPWAEEWLGTNSKLYTATIISIPTPHPWFLKGVCTPAEVWGLWVTTSENTADVTAALGPWVLSSLNHWVREDLLSFLL